MTRSEKVEREREREREKALEGNTFCKVVRFEQGEEEEEGQKLWVETTMPTLA